MSDWFHYASATSLIVTAGAALAAALIASGHAVLYKRDSRGAMMWVGLIWAAPLVGAGLYFALGINRIKRRATSLRRGVDRPRANVTPRRDATPVVAEPPVGAPHLAPLIDVVTRLTGTSLLAGNRIEPLINSEQAFPAMLAAIDAAQHSVSLSTYIFDRDDVGLAFATSLGAAVRRGVAVRVLIDATGTLLTRHSMAGVLRRNAVPFARFLPAISMRAPVSINLRTHRKLLVIDGSIGFTGGMNICVGRLRTKRALVPVEDIQFRLRGPVVADLQQAFVDDWEFATGEALDGARWFPLPETSGPMLARGIADGPDGEFEKIRWTILAAITMARRSLRILTPYFLPDTAIISALNIAAMRGVAVDIVLPTAGDVPFVQWASAAHWWQMLEHGCRIWVAPPPFDHSKLFIVDEAWVMVGSANWDPRSLRLNFEFNVECYDTGLAASLTALFEKRKGRARQVTLDEANGRSLPVRLRDGIARLATPFL